VDLNGPLRDSGLSADDAWAVAEDRSIHGGRYDPQLVTRSSE